MTNIFKCLICKKEFTTKDKRRKVCSIKCSHKYISIIKTGKPRSEKTKQKISKSRKGKYCGKNHSRYGVKLSDETKKKISDSVKQSHKDNGHPLQGKHHTDETKKLISNSLKYKYRGKNSPSWQGGKTLKGKFYRSLPEYLDWHKKVFIRDNYECQISGQIGGKLVVHHINSFCDNKEKRLELDNGVTMTKEVHKAFHKLYGKGGNNMTQLIEFTMNYNIKETNDLNESK